MVENEIMLQEEADHIQGKTCTYEKKWKINTSVRYIQEKRIFFLKCYVLLRIINLF